MRRGHSNLLPEASPARLSSCAPCGRRYVKGLRAAGFTPKEVRGAAYTIEEAKEAGYVEGLRAAGYTCEEATRAGYSIGELRLAGFVEGVKAAGWTCEQAKAGGYLVDLQACARRGPTSHATHSATPPPLSARAQL